MINESDYPYIDVSYKGKDYRFSCAVGDRLKSIRIVADEVFLDHSYVNGRCQINPGDSVLDGGAHIGMFTVFALLNGAKLVIAVEPNPTLFPILQHNVEKNVGIDKVIFFNNALWDCKRSRRNRLRFLCKRGNSQAGHVVENQKHNLWVRGLTIDSIRRKLGAIDFIKLDVEACERQALLGAVKTIKRNKPNLAVCLYHNRGDIVEIPNFIESLRQGYDKPFIFGNHFKVGLWGKPNGGVPA